MSSAEYAVQAKLARADRGPKSNEETITRQIANYIVAAAAEHRIARAEVTCPTKTEWDKLSSSRRRRGRAVLPNTSQLALYFNYKRKRFTDNVTLIAWREAQVYLEKYPEEFGT